MSNLSDSNKKFVENFFSALNRGDVEHIVDSYHEAGILQTMGNTLISGSFTREQVADSAGGIFDVFPNGLRFVITGLVVDEHKAAVEATSEGEHISGDTYSNEYHFLFVFKDGKLLRLKEYMDTERVTDILCGGQRPDS